MDPAALAVTNMTCSGLVLTKGLILFHYAVHNISDVGLHYIYS